MWGGGPLPTRGGVWERAVPPPRKFFSIFKLKKATFGAFWELFFAAD